MATLTLRHRLARVNPLVWIAAVAVIGGLVAWPLGGWETVVLKSTTIPDVEPGDTVAGNEYSVQVDSVEVTDVHPNGYSEPEPAWQYLVLTATVINETDRTQLSLQLGDDYSGIVTLDDGALGWGSTALNSSGYSSDADPYLIADGTFLPDLQPQLASPLLLVWEIPVGEWKAGDPLTVGVVDRTPYSCTLEIGTCYRLPTVVANVALTVEQGAIAPPPDPEDVGF